MDEDKDEGQTMGQRNAGDGEDRDQFASAAGTFVIHLFGRDGKERGDMTQ